jgi:hypothetical protein
MSRRIFISYRTVDGMDKATALSRDLGRIFGAGAVFLDKDDLRGGSDWREEIGRTLQSQPILLLLATPLLFEARSDDGRPRIADPADPVRRELEAALEARANIIPVMCDGLSAPPDTSKLPASFQRLHALTWRRLRAYDWNHDVERLAADLRALGVQAEPVATAPRILDAVPAPVPQGPARRLGVVSAVAAALLSVAVIGTWWAMHRGGEPSAASGTQADPAAVLAREGSSTAVGAKRDSGLPATPAMSASTTAAAGTSRADVTALPRVVLAGAGEITFSKIRRSTYTVLALKPEMAANGDDHQWRLRATVRLSAAPGSGGINFWDSSFRLLIDGVPRAPDSKINEIVDSGASKEGDFTWDVPHGTRTLALRVHHYGEAGDLALTLSGDAPAPVTAATAPGPVVLGLGAPPEVQFTKPRPVTFTVLSVVSRPMRSGVYGVHIRVRMALPANAVAANFWSDQFRLLVDGVPRAPDSDLSVVVEGGSARDGEVIFEVPTTARSMALRIQWAESAVADLPLKVETRQ